VSSAQYAAVALVVAVAVVAIVRFELLCFQDLSRRRDAELNYLSRAGWAVMIAVVIPIGGLVYLVCGRR
jgi:heme/copper-type cytochrome/quinol oxidase subunit 4